MANDIQRGSDGRILSAGGPGRPAGSRNRFTVDFLRDVLDAWTKHGAAELEIVAVEEPARFLSICASLVPTKAHVEIQPDWSDTTTNSGAGCHPCYAAFTLMT